MGTREEQKEKRRTEIIHAGLDLFIRKGYDATKVSDIAEKVGMSTGLLFHYFESKEKLYEELIVYGLSGPRDTFTALDSTAPLEFFTEAAKNILGYIKGDIFTAKMFVLMNQAYLNEAAPQKAKEMLSHLDVFTPTAELIKKGQKDGTIRDGDPNALGLAFWSAIQGIAWQIALDPDTPCPESEWIVDIIRRKE